MTNQDLSPDPAARLARARLSLDGLSVGDAFGERFFGPHGSSVLRISARATPPPPWRYTDDTAMALSLVEVLERFGCVNQDELARAFARRYAKEPDRGYGGAAHRILGSIADGLDWRIASPLAFGGAGSMGNGGAMRVAPLGAYFADDLARAAAEARLSAEVTHAHSEGQAGAIAIAVAAAQAARGLGTGRTLLEVALAHTPPGSTRDGIDLALALPEDCTVSRAADSLGNGSQVTAPDTVPFALWCAATYCLDYPEALWETASGLGDIDTNCAIVGGIVALAAGRAAIPADWLQAREPLA